jgi:hypothetical protein
MLDHYFSFKARHLVVIVIKNKQTNKQTKAVPCEHQCEAENEAVFILPWFENCEYYIIRT